MLDLVSQLDAAVSKQTVDIITFAEDKQFCGMPLYPRQKVLLKLLFLMDLTDEEHAVVDYWEAGGRNGTEIELCPNVRDRVKYLKDAGFPHFREIVLVGGRRSSKGYLTGVCLAYKIYQILQYENPGKHFGISETKEIYFSVIAASQDQAAKQQYADFANTVNACAALQPFLFKLQELEFSIMTKQNLSQMEMWKAKGQKAQRLKDISTIRGNALPANSRTIRGASTMAYVFDEVGHFMQGESDQSDTEVYAAAIPSLAQFGRHAIMFLNSSPYSKTGVLFQHFQSGLELDEDGKAMNPTAFAMRYPSWALYEGWWDSEEAISKGIRKCQYANPDWDLGQKRKDGEYFYSEDDRYAILQSRNEERDDPEKFKVENRCLDPETRVLTAELEWKPIKELTLGERLVGLDEKPPGNGGKRRLKTASVTGLEWSRQKSYTITFADQTEVICSANHRWFSSTGHQVSRKDIIGSGYRWRPTKRLHPGDHIRCLVEPWEEDSSWGAGWLADTYKVDGFAEFLGQIKPVRLRANSLHKFWEDRALPCFEGWVHSKEIIGIEENSVQDLVDIETTTGTFIAEGLISHNSRFAEVLDAYLNPESVDRMFAGIPDEEGVTYRPLATNMTASSNEFKYRAHLDPSSTTCGFGFALGHVEPLTVAGRNEEHVVFDILRRWDPQDFPNGVIQWEPILEEIVFWIEIFRPTEVTMDCHQSAFPISWLNRVIAQRRLGETRVYTKPATSQLNWNRAEIFKTALYRGLVHAPHDTGDALWTEQELKNLQISRSSQIPKVDHPDVGPIQTSDCYDAVSHVVEAFIGNSFSRAMRESLTESVRTGAQGGYAQTRVVPRPLLSSDGEAFTRRGGATDRKLQRARSATRPRGGSPISRRLPGW